MTNATNAAAAPAAARDPDIAALLAAHRAARAGAAGPLAGFFARCDAALEAPGRANPDPGSRQFPVCDRIEAGLAVARADGSPEIARLADCLARLAPRLGWRRREGLESDDPNFPEGHANAVLLGADGLELHRDVRLGVSLLAPGVTYPDHRHPPEEGYLVLSGGDWRQDRGPWFARAPGETVHNVPNIWHAMRAGAEAPLLALWMLWTGR